MLFLAVMVLTAVSVIASPSYMAMPEPGFSKAAKPLVMAASSPAFSAHDEGIALGIIASSTKKSPTEAAIEEQLRKDAEARSLSSPETSARPGTPGTGGVRCPLDDVPGGFDVDYVITWFNSDDPKAAINYSDRLQTVVRAELTPDATRARRYINAGEVRYNLRSLSKNAKWIRNIHLVVPDGVELPSWLRLEGQSKLKVVRHGEIFEYPADLPTFNSHAIEANLHRIPGLAEHFVYSNDGWGLWESDLSKFSHSLATFADTPYIATDMFINVPSSRCLFFTDDGKPRVWSNGPYDSRGRGSHYIAMRNTLALVEQADITLRIWPPKDDLNHQAKAQTISAMKWAHELWPTAWNNTVHHPFRHREDVWAIWLASVMCVEHNLCYYDDPRPFSASIDVPNKSMAKIMLYIETMEPILFCLNDADPRTAKDLATELNRHFPEPSPFEDGYLEVGHDRTRDSAGV